MDKYANSGSMMITESALNTLTFQKIETGLSLFQKVGWILHRIDWFFISVNSALLPDTGDSLEMAITTRSDLVLIGDLTSDALVDHVKVEKWEDAAPTSSWMWNPLITHDFTGLPMGGILVAPNPLYMAIKGNGLAAATYGQARWYYTVVDLKGDDYFELLQSRLSQA